MTRGRDTAIPIGCALPAWVAVAALSAAPLMGHAATPPARDTGTVNHDQSLTNAFDKVIAPYVTSGQFMGSVIVARHGHILLSKGYGYADLELRRPNAPKTKFHLGSVTKQFTAAAILLLAERGQLSLDDPVTRYVPDAPPSWAPMTIYHLLTHTAGLYNVTEDRHFDSFSQAPITPLQMLSHYRDVPLAFKPGARFQYSNSGYMLLGYIIEKVSGRPYGEFVQRNLFDVLGMRDSGVYPRGAPLTDQAIGYTRNDTGTERAIDEDPSVPFSAGSLYSTTMDLLKWEEGLMGGTLLHEESLHRMLTPFKGDYGLGVWIREEDGHRIIEHGGGIEGFNTALAYYPDERLVIATLSNVNGSAPWAMRPQLAAVARRKAPAARHTGD